MDQTNYELDLPRENIHLRCFAHNIMNYRYHWHTDEYELSIVLQGNQQYCRGTDTHTLLEDDLPRAMAMRLRASSRIPGHSFSIFRQMH